MGSAGFVGDGRLIKRIKIQFEDRSSPPKNKSARKRNFEMRTPPQISPRRLDDRTFSLILGIPWRDLLAILRKFGDPKMFKHRSQDVILGHFLYQSGLN